MFEWLLWLFFVPASMGAADVQTPPEHYVGLVAAEAAYTTLLPRAPEPDKPPVRPIDPNCPTCKGKGKVPSGDGQGWSNCPTCQPLMAPDKPVLPRAKSTLPPGPFAKPPGNAPLGTAPPCVNGTCPVEKAAPAAPLFGIPFVTAIGTRKRTPRRR